MKIRAIIEEHIDTNYSKSTPVIIDLDDEALTQLAIAIFNAKVEGLFKRAGTLVEKLSNLDFQSLF
jgi:hypothetical protein